jgi:hypothetical protein
MSSIVKLDGTRFCLPQYQTGRFISLGQQLENRGITHSIFLRQRPVSNNYFVSERHSLSGYCAYYFLYNTQKILVGVVFTSHVAKTVVSDFRLVVGDCLVELPENFVPNFTLENCGILIFKGNDGSVLLVPVDVDSSLIVRTE